MALSNYHPQKPALVTGLITLALFIPVTPEAFAKQVSKVLTAKNKEVLEHDRGEISVKMIRMTQLEDGREKILNFGDLLKVSDIFSYIKTSRQTVSSQDRSRQRRAALGVRTPGLVPGSGSTQTVSEAEETLGEEGEVTGGSTSTTETNKTDLVRDTLGEPALEGWLASDPDDLDSPSPSYHDLMYATANTFLGGRALENQYDFSGIPDKWHVFIAPAVFSVQPGRVTRENYMAEATVCLNHSEVFSNLHLVAVAPNGFSQIVSDARSDFDSTHMALAALADAGATQIEANLEQYVEKLERLRQLSRRADFKVRIEEFNNVTFKALGRKSLDGAVSLEEQDYSVELILVGRLRETDGSTSNGRDVVDCDTLWEAVQQHKSAQNKWSSAISNKELLQDELKGLRKQEKDARQELLDDFEQIETLTTTEGAKKKDAKTDNKLVVELESLVQDRRDQIERYSNNVERVESRLRKEKDNARVAKSKASEAARRESELRDVIEKALSRLSVSAEVIRQASVVDVQEKFKLAHYASQDSGQVSATNIAYMARSEFVPTHSYHLVPRIFRRHGKKHRQNLRTAWEPGVFPVYFFKKDTDVRVKSIQLFPSLNKISIVGNNLKTPGLTFTAWKEDGGELRSLPSCSTDVASNVALLTDVCFADQKKVFLEITGRVTNTNGNENLVTHLVVPVKVAQKPKSKDPKPRFQGFVDTAVFSVDHVVVDCTFKGNVNSTISMMINGREVQPSVADIQQTRKANSDKGIEGEFTYHLVSTAPVRPVGEDGVPPKNVLVTLKDEAGKIIHSQMAALQ